MAVDAADDADKEDRRRRNEDDTSHEDIGEAKRAKLFGEEPCSRQWNSYAPFLGHAKETAVSMRSVLAMPVQALQMMPHQFSHHHKARLHLRERIMLNQKMQKGVESGRVDEAAVLEKYGGRIFRISSHLRTLVDKIKGIEVAHRNKERLCQIAQKKEFFIRFCHLLLP